MSLSLLAVGIEKMHFCFWCYLGICLKILILFLWLYGQCLAETQKNKDHFFIEVILEKNTLISETWTSTHQPNPNKFTIFFFFTWLILMFLGNPWERSSFDVECFCFKSTFILTFLYALCFQRSRSAIGLYA